MFQSFSFLSQCDDSYDTLFLTKCDHNVCQTLLTTAITFFHSSFHILQFFLASCKLLHASHQITKSHPKLRTEYIKKSRPHAFCAMILIAATDGFHFVAHFTVSLLQRPAYPALIRSPYSMFIAFCLNIYSTPLEVFSSFGSWRQCITFSDHPFL